MEPSIAYERLLHEAIDRFYDEGAKECANCYCDASDDKELEDLDGLKFCSESCLEDWSNPNITPIQSGRAFNWPTIDSFD